MKSLKSWSSFVNPAPTSTQKLLSIMVIVFIPHFLYIYIQMRFKLLQCKGEIGHQHI